MDQWILAIMRIRRDTYLMITNVIVTFVDAFTIGTVVQCLCYVLNVGYAIYNGACRPMGISLGHGIQVYCGVGSGTKHQLCVREGSILFFALYGHSFSMGHSRHRDALPAAIGFLSFLKCCRDPNEETLVGVAGDSQ